MTTREKLCSVKGCGRNVYARGKCFRHDRGSTRGPGRPRRPPTNEGARLLRAWYERVNGLNQARLLIAISYATANRYMRGGSLPDRATRAELKKLCKISVDAWDREVSK